MIWLVYITKQTIQIYFIFILISRELKIIIKEQVINKIKVNNNSKMLYIISMVEGMFKASVDDILWNN